VPVRRRGFPNARIREDPNRKGGEGARREKKEREHVRGLKNSSGGKKKTRSIKVYRADDGWGGL